MAGERKNLRTLWKDIEQKKRREQERGKETSSKKISHEKKGKSKGEKGKTYNVLTFPKGHVRGKKKSKRKRKGSLGSCGSQKKESAKETYGGEEKGARFLKETTNQVVKGEKSVPKKKAKGRDARESSNWGKESGKKEENIPGKKGKGGGGKNRTPHGEKKRGFLRTKKNLNNTTGKKKTQKRVKGKGAALSGKKEKTI